MLNRVHEVGFFFLADLLVFRKVSYVPFLGSIFSKSVIEVNFNFLIKRNGHHGIYSLLSLGRLNRRLRCLGAYLKSLGPEPFWIFKIFGNFQFAPWYKFLLKNFGLFPCAP